MRTVTFAEDEERRRHVVRGGADVKREKEKCENIRYKLQDNLMFMVKVGPSYTYSVHFPFQTIHVTTHMDMRPHQRTGS